jgi:hypothetical protein
MTAIRTLIRRLISSGNEANYSALAPTAQNALDIFAGEWISRLPPPFHELRAGSLPVFDDPRIAWAIERLGGVTATRILELGPLEGGHSYMLDRAGAREVLSIEGNRRAFLKCLVIRDIVGMPAVRFAHGDFVTYLRSSQERWDTIIASGVLYHMTDPIELIARAAGACSALFLWSHYVDEGRPTANPLYPGRRAVVEARTYDGFSYAAYRHDYRMALARPDFCGGPRRHSCWLTRTTILAALSHFGFTSIETAHEEPHHQNGPAFSVLARK